MNEVRRGGLALVCLAWAIGFGVPASAQSDGATATRRQQKNLVPLVTSVCRRLELHIPSITAADVERRVRKALHNQLSSAADRHYKELVVNLIMEDLDLEKAERRTVEYELLEEFGRSIPQVDATLLGLEKKEWKTRDKETYLIKGIYREHRACLRASQEMLWKLRGWNGVELDSDQRRGIKELAAHYSTVIQEAFGIERKDKDFTELLESALSNADTDLAVLTTLCKLRTLVRPIVYRVHVVNTVAKKVEAREIVGERIEEVLVEGEWWTQLRVDHGAMLADPKQHRKVIKERKKS